MILRTCYLLAVSLALSGCASDAMYDRHGYLTEYGEGQTDAEISAIFAACESTYSDYESAQYDCLRPAVPLYQRFHPALADLFEEQLDTTQAIAFEYELRRMRQQDSFTQQDVVWERYNRDMARLIQEYNQVVATSRAQDEYLKRQRIAAAISQAGRDIANSSSTGVDDLSIDGTSGHLIGEQSSGGNKICYYNVVGSTYSKNIGAAQICPLTAEF